jgi:hypothetical protein
MLIPDLVPFKVLCTQIFRKVAVLLPKDHSIDVDIARQWQSDTSYTVSIHQHVVFSSK